MDVIVNLDLPVATKDMAAADVWMKVVIGYSRHVLIDIFPSERKLVVIK